MRSAANVYWLRSLVPIDTKSTCSSNRSASSAADGVSIMTPAVSPRSRMRRATSAASDTTATMGAMTHTSASDRAAAAAIASSWWSSSSGRSVAMRSPRMPRAGLGSVPMSANASGLSEPASSVRTTTLCVPAASSTAA